MLPWLVVPLIAIWAATQLLLPAAYRFEVTSPRLACVSVLPPHPLLVRDPPPQLSLWRARRSRASARSAARTRSSSTSSARPPPDAAATAATPTGTRTPAAASSCAPYCGHVSKRPVLDLNSAGRPPQVALRSGLWRLARPALLLQRQYLLLGVLMAPAVVIFTATKVGKGGENGGKAEESRVERARRKAEEKRLVRLEREMLEEEERKQQGRDGKAGGGAWEAEDEKAEAEEAVQKALPLLGRKDARREAEAGARREEERGQRSSKSNSDCEDIDGRLGEKRRQSEPSTERWTLTGVRVTSLITLKLTIIVIRQWRAEQSSPTSFKKSWHQLFSRSASVSPCPDATTSARDMNRKPEPNGAQISNARTFLSQYPPLDSKPSSSQSMQFPGFPPVNGVPPNKPLPHFPAGHMPFYDDAESAVFEDSEQFEDPCYDPDAIALLGPVSESLDNFLQTWIVDSSQ
ncbi:unnamed protein product [Miscanthus lutarioriparius]|uniref:Uncharacterized protein n=1 Tax=Miscanthus lutarioriparius TaxID=422564 RepID=A0A811QRS3_9POAL|nr:unnamed protein product [Miscanthus lutarioriparius]